MIAARPAGLLPRTVAAHTAVHPTVVEAAGLIADQCRLTVAEAEPHRMAVEVGVSVVAADLQAAEAEFTLQLRVTAQAGVGAEALLMAAVVIRTAVTNLIS